MRGPSEDYGSAIVRVAAAERSVACADSPLARGTRSTDPAGAGEDARARPTAREGRDKEPRPMKPKVTEWLERRRVSASAGNMPRNKVVAHSRID
jgi:hypothetical protein